MKALSATYTVFLLSSCLQPTELCSTSWIIWLLSVELRFYEGEKNRSVSEKQNFLLPVLKVTKATAGEKLQNTKSGCSDGKWHTLVFCPQIGENWVKG